MDSLLALNHVWYVSENRYCIDLAGDFFPQKYHIFLDVIHILEFQGSLEVLLRNGYVYLLSGNTSAWKLIDICSEKNYPIYKCALNELNQRLLVL